MKIRNGFVSNSSTTSFCIYGLCLSSNQIGLVQEKHGVDDLDDLTWGEKKLDTCLEFHYGQCGDQYAGCGWEHMGPDETSSQFKERISKALTDLLGVDVTIDMCGFHEESWYNG